MSTPGNSSGLEVASIFFGIFIGLLFFTTVKVARQSWHIWKRTRSLSNWYLWMIWVETTVNFLFALTTYLFIRGTIPPSLAYYCGAVFLWMLQTQLLLQIIANRVGLIIVDRRKSRLIKWVLFVVIGLVNISVFCIWIPAQMRTNQTFVALNHIWERIEKSIFLCVDLGLNVYFLYLVRSQLIGRGLTKYWPLFHFNAAIVIVSVSMDVLLLGLLSLPNPFDYVQFAPVAYTVKLNIELTMAVLISKVVRGVHRVDDHDSSTNYAANGTNISSRIDVVTSTQQQHGYFPGSIEKNKNIRVEKTGGHLSASDRDRYQGEGIIKTMTMTMTEDGE